MSDDNVTSQEERRRGRQEGEIVNELKNIKELLREIKEDSKEFKKDVYGRFEANTLEHTAISVKVDKLKWYASGFGSAFGAIGGFLAMLAGDRG